MREKLHISTQEYFDLPYCSNSGLKEAARFFKEGDMSPIESSGFAFGSVFDALMTDITELDSSELSNSERISIINMRSAIIGNPIYSALFTGKDTETQVVWVDKELDVMIDGMPMQIPAKCKYDLWNNRLDFGADLKSTVAKTERSFKKAAKFFKYHMQAAWYMDISKTDRFVIFGISKENYKVFIININRGSEAYEAGRKAYEEYLPYWWRLSIIS